MTVQKIEAAATVTLTENEAAVMLALKHNYYGENGDGVWSHAVNDSHKPSGIKGKALAGVIGSLVKKGLISSEEYEPGQDVIWMKAAGKEYLKTVD